MTTPVTTVQMDSTMANLKGLWHLNYNENPVRDDSGNGNTGAYIGTPVFNASGRFDGAYDFSGSNTDALRISYTADLWPESADYTVIVWVKTNAANQDESNMWSCWDGSNAYVFLRLTNAGATHADKGAYFVVRASDNSFSQNLNSTIPIADNKWHMLAGVLNRGTDTGYVYVDGAEEDVMTTLVGLGNILDVNSNHAIGNYADGNNRSLKGTEDEVAIFKGRALSAAEIWNIYHKQPTLLF